MLSQYAISGRCNGTGKIEVIKYHVIKQYANAINFQDGRDHDLRDSTVMLLPDSNAATSYLGSHFDIAFVYRLKDDLDVTLTKKDDLDG